MSSIARRLFEIKRLADDETTPTHELVDKIGLVATLALRDLDRLPAEVVALRQKLRECSGGYETKRRELVALQTRIAELEAKLNTPQLHDFAAAVVIEAAHQRERWGSEHDAGKQASDWFWLLGYLGGKALNAATSGNIDKALHHTISTAAACANWHAALSGEHTTMRPGIDPVEKGLA